MIGYSDGKLMRSAVVKLECSLLGLFDNKYVGCAECSIDGSSVVELLKNLLGIIVSISLGDIDSLILG